MKETYNSTEDPNRTDGMKKESAIIEFFRKKMEPLGYEVLKSSHIENCEEKIDCYMKVGNLIWYIDVKYSPTHLNGSLPKISFESSKNKSSHYLFHTRRNNKYYLLKKTDILLNISRDRIGSGMGKYYIIKETILKEYDMLDSFINTGSKSDSDDEEDYCNPLF